LAVGLSKAEDIIGVMDRLWGDRTAIASLAPLVTKAANNGDLLAMKIIDDATDELALAVNTVYNHLIFVHPFVCIVGSLGNSEGYFKTQLHQKIKAINPHFELVAPMEDPAFAAAKLAYETFKNLSL
jgi:N-acetylglucosamine kinase